MLPQTREQRQVTVGHKVWQSAHINSFTLNRRGLPAEFSGNLGQSVSPQIFISGINNIIRYCDRPFRRVEDMDQTILERLNASYVSMEQAESNRGSPGVLTRKKWFVHLGMAACGIASYSSAAVSGRVLMQAMIRGGL